MSVRACIGLVTLATLVSGAWGATSADQRPEMSGRRDAATTLLPTQWSLRPAGDMIRLGDFPANMALAPDGAHLAVVSCGAGDHEVMLIDVTGPTPRITCRVPLPNIFWGLAWSSDGSRLFVSGGGDNVVHVFERRGGLLGNQRSIRVAPQGAREFVAGVALTPDGRTLLVALTRSARVVAVDLATADQTTPEVRRIAAWNDEVFPYDIVVEPDGQHAWVSLWGGGAVVRLPLEGREQWRLRVETGNQPNDLLLSPDGARLFAACANDNTVRVIDTAERRTAEVLNTALHPHSPEGSTPNGLALSPDGETLFVANADNNDVAVFDVGVAGQAAGEGFIPVGWYPTAVCLSRDGSRLFVTNGKGDQSFANPQGPNPMMASLTTMQYIARLLPGTLSYIELFDASPDPLAPQPSLPPGERGNDWEARLSRWTQDAYDCSPYRADLTPVVSPEADNPIPARVGDPSPITHVVYIIKENRTYDQVFGDMPEGNGDPRLCLFPEEVTPNHHALAREFVLFDNFYVESEVSADGHEWSTAAYATSFVERVWPPGYGAHVSLGYPAEGSFRAAFPDAGYIWDRCRAAGVTYRSYGEFIRNGETPDDPGTATMESLEGHFDPWFRGYDLEYRDVDRAKRFLAELASFEATGEMPRFIVLRLPNDHTSGTRVGRPTPRAYVADNDLALGQIIEGLSHSRFWPHLAVFVVEDDAQNGPDHVDAHRTVALVASPWARRGAVDSHMYSTASMLRTMELILGLEPMSQFDAGARPMYAAFTRERDLTPYTCRPATWDLDEVNAPDAPLAEVSARLPLDEGEDRADDLLFNETVWRGVRGADSPMPPPVRAAFLRPLAEDEEAEAMGN